MLISERSGVLGQTCPETLVDFCLKAKNFQHGSGFDTGRDVQFLVRAGDALLLLVLEEEG